jgi:hypothetical protein
MVLSKAEVALKAATDAYNAKLKQLQQQELLLM